MATSELPTPGGPPQPAHIREYMDLIAPYTAEPDERQAVMNARPRADALLHTVVARQFMPEWSDFQGQITAGSYTVLMEQAETSAGVIVENDRGEMTLPRLFAIHALASVTASSFRPHITEVPHTNDRTTYFLTQFATKLALAIPEQVIIDGPDPMQLAKVLGKRSLLLATGVNESASWLQAKLDSLAEGLALRRHVMGVIDNEPTAEVADLRELRLNNNKLMKELTRLRRYSIKSAVHEGEGSSWSIHDMYDIRLMQASLIEGEGSDIRIDRWSTMVMSAVQEPSGDKNRLNYLTLANDIAEIDYSPLGHLVFMDDQGELFADMNGAMSLKYMYEVAGKPVNYESLRQLLLSNYYDLTVPLEIVKEVGEATRTMLGSRDPDIDRERGNVQYDLLIPRIRSLRRFTRPEDLDELEARAAREAKPLAFPRVAHPRKLPPGYKASDHARQMAAEDGVVLGEGETYVRRYEPDPSIAKPVLHRARRRKDGGKDSREKEHRDDNS